MERDTLPETVVISQDEQTEVHIQPVAQRGRRHLDIRLWRRGNGTLAPSRKGVTLEGADLIALQRGIGDLLQASDGGKRVAKVVCDGDDGRRLRAETEPFGAKHVARLGFWQRVRDSWKPVDNGLVVAADRLSPLQTVLDQFRSWLQAGASAQVAAQEITENGETHDKWPSAGADWLTEEEQRVAFHPKGMRLTCTVAEHGARHWLVVRQWKRDDNLWVPENIFIALSIVELDQLLAQLLHVADIEKTGNDSPAGEIEPPDGSSVRLRVDANASRHTLEIEQQLHPGVGMKLPAESHLSVPLEHVPRFGRALAQAWFLLAGWLSDVERAELRQYKEGTFQRLGVLAEAVAQGHAYEQERLLDVPVSAYPQPLGANLAIGQVFSFGAESETPGTIIPAQRDIQISVEAGRSRRDITIPVDIAVRILPALQKLDGQRQRQPKVDPFLLCDRRDCAVYARVGVPSDPHVAEVRVWSRRTASHSIAFEASYLPDLIASLRQALRLMGYPVSIPSGEGEIFAIPPAPLPSPSFPARWRVIAPRTPLQRPGPLGVTDHQAKSSVPLDISLGTLSLGDHAVKITVEGHREHPGLVLQWESNLVELPVNHLDRLVSDMRNLYYDALRGMRRKPLSMGEYPITTVRMQNKGPELLCFVEQEIDGEVTSLSFPANEVPSFLGTVREALTRV